MYCQKGKHFCFGAFAEIMGTMLVNHFVSVKVYHVLEKWHKLAVADYANANENRTSSKWRYQLKRRYGFTRPFNKAIAEPPLKFVGNKTMEVVVNMLHEPAVDGTITQGCW